MRPVIAPDDIDAFPVKQSKIDSFVDNLFNGFLIKFYLNCISIKLLKFFK